MTSDSGTNKRPNTQTKQTEEATTADVFRILSNRRRRYAMLFFLYHDPTPDLRELAQQVAAWEHQKSVDSVTTEERRRVYNAFQQFHLPKMDKAGVIDYDSTKHTIESTEGVRLARPYLEVIPGTSLPWCLYYLAFGGISITLALATVINVIPIPGTVLALGISFVLVVSGVVHAQTEWRRMNRKNGEIGRRD